MVLHHLPAFPVTNMPHITTPQAKAAARKLLAAITLRVRFDRDSLELYWLHDGRGPSERAGAIVKGKSILFGGVSVSTDRVKWMLANGTPLYKNEILVDSESPVYARRAITRPELAAALRARKRVADQRGVSPASLPLRYTEWRYPDGSPALFLNAHHERSY